VREINRFEWSVSRGECDRGQIDIRPWSSVLGGWTLVLAETFCAILNCEILSWKPCGGFVSAGGSEESGSVQVVVNALLMCVCAKC
jgi:hypothetical protein